MVTSLTSFCDTPPPFSYPKHANWTPGQWSGPGSDSLQENVILLEKASVACQIICNIIPLSDGQNLFQAIQEHKMDCNPDL
jgi:hypothetical protein